jgi:8-oxo-dGTP diphosphatase
MSSVIHVVAGALFDPDGRVLIAQRPAGKHMAGGWEFPGGKVEPGEEPRNALMRELHEELGVVVHAATQLIAYEHQYPHRRLLLDLWAVTRYSGHPQPLDAPALEWVAIEDLQRVGLLEADWPMVPALRDFYSSRSKKRTTIS